MSVEHIYAKSTKRTAFASDEDSEKFSLMKDQLQNLTLLERTLNNGLDDKPFLEKRATYAESAFALTRQLGDLSGWTFDTATRRAEELADLAVSTWTY